ncbi:MAG TPA: class B sortase [Candidatus Scybalocola faecavium]|nr:class B sortase [Candidatus Scybalocola faecavium]
MKKKKKRNWLLNIILVIAILCFLGSGGYLLKYYWDNWQAQKNIAALEDMILPDDSVQAQTGEDGELESGGSDRQTATNRYARLLEKNPDFIGWIQIPDTPISYPVMYTPQDPEFYLHRNFEREYEYSGLPFVDGNCSLDPRSTNVIIYGHNMKSDTMFSHLLDYRDEDFYKEHPYITFNTIYGDGQYEIVSVILARALYEDEDGFRYYGMIDPASQEEFDEYMENIHSLELYDTGVDAEYGDQLLTLSTCEYSQENGRLAIIAKKI